MFVHVFPLRALGGTWIQRLHTWAGRCKHFRSSPHWDMKNSRRRGCWTEMEASWRSSHPFLFAWKQLDARDRPSNTPTGEESSLVNGPSVWGNVGTVSSYRKDFSSCPSLPIPESPSAICFSCLCPFHTRSQLCFQSFLKTKMQIQRNTEEEKKRMLWDRAQHQVHGYGYPTCPCAQKEAKAPRFHPVA